MGGNWSSAKRRCEETFRAGPFDRCGALVPDGVDEDSGAVDLKKGGGVAEPGDAETGGGRLLVDAGVGVEGTELAFRCPLFLVSKVMLEHLEHHRRSAYRSRRRVLIAVADAFGRFEGHAWVGCSSDKSLIRRRYAGKLRSMTIRPARSLAKPMQLRWRAHSRAAWSRRLPRPWPRASGLI